MLGCLCVQCSKNPSLEQGKEPGTKNQKAYQKTKTLPLHHLSPPIGLDSLRVFLHMQTRSSKCTQYAKNALSLFSISHLEFFRMLHHLFRTGYILVQDDISFLICLQCMRNFVLACFNRAVSLFLQNYIFSGRDR